MTSQNRPNKIGDLVALGSAGSVLYFTYQDAFPMISWLILAGAAVLCWACLLMPTWCDYQTQRGTPCTRRVRGKLRGCRQHSRLKRDAMFAAMGMRNPGMVIRVMWSAPDDLSRTSPVAQPCPVRQTEPALTKQSASDAIMLVATVVGSLASVVALFV